MKRVGLLLILSAWGCSDVGPTGPTTIPPNLAATSALGAGTTLSFLSGETGVPVTGARVMIGGREHTTDASGQIALLEPATTGTFFEVEGTGFLKRETTVALGGTMPVELWPSESPTRLDAEYTRQLVYVSSGTETLGQLEPLERPRVESGRVSLVLSPEIIEDGVAMAAVGDAAAGMTEALDGLIVYRVGAGASGVRVELKIDPNDEALRERSVRAITRCEIVYRSMEIVRSNTTLHEIGHTFGLNHSPDPGEIMGIYRTGDVDSFSSREKLAMRLMLKRPPGNVFPDNDRDAVARASRTEESAVVCVLPDQQR